MTEDYWRERCLAAEAVIEESTLKQTLGHKGSSYQPGWYEAVTLWQKIKNTYEQIRTVS